jgi:hypothetical protein
MPDLIRHPVLSWIPASAGMTVYAVTYGVLYKTINRSQNEKEDS